jgi:hypothetical protein
MSPKSASRLAATALIAVLAMPLSAALPAALPFAVSSAQAGIVASHEATLASYGSFYDHPKYGKVWMPSATVAPMGWHPYQPCHWVNTKYGWYFQDNTPWGAIVHHYGRWTHEAKLGWMWVPGEEFSPGWVVWRTSEQWVGWAPTPPDQDMKTLDADEFNSDKMWTFMETAKFAKGCTDGAVVAASQVPVLLAQTTIVKEFVFVDGILVFVLPPWLVGPFVEIDVLIAPWSPTFITTVINNWIFVWNTVNINIACAPSKIKPIKSTPPLLPLPTPPQKRADNPPTFTPPTFTPPSFNPPTFTPPGPQKPFVPPQIVRTPPGGPQTSFNPPQIVRPLPLGPKTSFNPPEIKRTVPTFTQKPFVPQITRNLSQQPKSFGTLATVGSAQRASFPSTSIRRKSIM